jgi:hypothetical protein
VLPSNAIDCVRGRGSWSGLPDGNLPVLLLLATRGTSGYMVSIRGIATALRSKNEISRAYEVGSGGRLGRLVPLKGHRVPSTVLLTPRSRIRCHLRIFAFCHRCVDSSHQTVVRSGS